MSAVKLLLKQYIQCTHPLGIISLCFIQSVPRKMLFHKNVTLFTEIAIFPVQAMFCYNVHNFGTKFLFKSFLAEINSLQCQCYMSCQEKPQFMQFFSLSKRCKNTIDITLIKDTLCSLFFYFVCIFILLQYHWSMRVSLLLGEITIVGNNHWEHIPYWECVHMNSQLAFLPTKGNLTWCE